MDSLRINSIFDLSYEVLFLLFGKGILIFKCWSEIVKQGERYEPDFYDRIAYLPCSPFKGHYDSYFLSATQVFNFDGEKR